MMRSLFSAMTGLRNHQVRMDVIGNNIANVNTVGFKANRVTFQEELNQVLRDATKPSGAIGGRNPMTVGLGVSVGTVDTLFSQGAVENTERATDLAIQGEGFFVLSDGTRRLFTRAGNFVLDAEGRLVHPSTGYVLQGKLANEDGEIRSGAPVEDIVLPFGRKDPAKATTLIRYQCNLNADSDAKREVWTMNRPFTSWARVTGSGGPNSLTITSGANDELKISLDGGTARTITIAEGTYADVDELVDAINNAIAADSVLNGEVVAENRNGVVSFRTTDTGEDSSIKLLEGNGGLANLNIEDGASDTGLADEDTPINELAEVSVDLVDGDEINISGTNPDGSVVSSTFTYGTTNDGTTVADLVAKIEDAFTGVTASFEDGKIVLTDDEAGESQTSISLNAMPTNTGTISLYGFTNTVAGRDAGSHSASIFVYDSLGNRHTVEITFTKADEPNTWTWEVEVDGGLISPTAGYKGRVTFNNDGSLAAFTSDDNQPLKFDPGSGADPMEVRLDAGRSGGYDGITQLSAPSTTIASYQDGHGMGVLSGISIDAQGRITGTFTNGTSQVLAQIVLANFTNEEGLKKAGNNLFEPTANSGDPIIGLAGTNFPTIITPGALELSNVDLVREFTDMIVTQRGFQANARVITTTDAMLDEVIRIRR